jgi:multidrug efflux pump subunit AcrA (membrane-fusion protein)
MAAPGMPLLRVEDLRGFRLEVRVDESRISRVQAGQPVEVILDVTSGTQQALTGTVAEVSRAVDVDARSFLVKIALPEGRDIRSGTFGRARFSAGTRRGLRLPDRALVRRGQLTSVFVVEEGIARLRLVNVSDHEILAGLSEGETVIVGPPPELVDGRRVTAGGK